MPKYKCKICNSHKIVKINLAKKKSLTSDGNIISSKLYKYKCFECGLFFNPKKYEIINYKRSSGAQNGKRLGIKTLQKEFQKFIRIIFRIKKNTLKF